MLVVVRRLRVVVRRVGMMRRVRVGMVRRMRVMVVVRRVVMGVAEVGRRRREDVSEVGEEEEGRESDEEQLRAIHGASRRRTASWASPVSVSLETRVEGGQGRSLAVAGREPPLQPAMWVPMVSGRTRRPASLVPWWRVGVRHRARNLDGDMRFDSSCRWLDACGRAVLVPHGPFSKEWMGRSV